MADENRNPYASELLTPPGFLIIGITGPWGSGCTTTAEMIEKSTQSEVLDFLDDTIPKLEQRIRDCEERISGRGLPAGTSSLAERRPTLQALDPDLGVDDYDRSEASHRPDGLRGHYHSLMMSYLEQHRWMEALRRAAEDQEEDVGSEWQRFQRISMSDMILKVAVESCDGFDRRIHGDYGEIVRRLKQFRADHKDRISAAEAITNALYKKDYPKVQRVKRAGASFEEYLLALSQLNNDLRKSDPLCAPGFLQNCGDNLRQTGKAFPSEREMASPDHQLFGGRIAEEANICTKYFREAPTGRRTSWFIIETFRNRIEVEHFRRRVENFFLISLYASQEARRHRKLGDGQLDKAERDRWRDFERRDQGHQEGTGTLNVQDCATVADIAIDNDANGSDATDWQKRLRLKVFRSLALMMEPGCCPPTRHETLMHQAQSAALRSTCISRQVGAVITSPLGHVLAVGWNDPGMGQVGCGLLTGSVYTSGNELGSRLNELRNDVIDQSDGLVAIGKYKLDDHEFVCYKDAASLLKTAEAIAGLREEDKDAAARGEAVSFDDDLMRHAHRLNIKRLEFCRSLHAEENALLQVTRLGGISVQGGTIYTTASPCELCTKKIYQSGLSRIVYTDVYPGPFANAFRRDGIREIAFVQFEGVKSPGYFRLFRPDYPLKDAQKLR